MNGPLQDYMGDMVFIGLITDERFNFESIHYPWFYFKGNNVADVYGRGFTLYGKLEKSFQKEEPDIDLILSKIKDGFYDKIIYPSIWRFNKYFNYCVSSVGEDNVIAIDGEDQPMIHPEYAVNCKYFKRELTSIYYRLGIKPISFFIPEYILQNIKSLIDLNPPKIKVKAHCDPRDKSTYIYNDEESYYKQYQSSFFGFTQVKSGWDCLRHYEIIASGAIPYFENIEEMPCNTMKNYPKKLQLKANNLYKKMKKSDETDNFAKEYQYLQIKFDKWLCKSALNLGSNELLCCFKLKKKRNRNFLFKKIFKFLLKIINKFLAFRYFLFRIKSKKSLFYKFIFFIKNIKNIGRIISQTSGRFYHY